MEEKEYLLWPDLLKIVSIYAVILVHSAAPLLVRYHELGALQWWIGNLYDASARWCIPLFVMVSGTFVLGNSDGNAAGLFSQKRVMRVFVPFLVWSFIYFLWRIYGNGEELSFSSFLPLIFVEPVYYHLWYLYIIIGLYLIAPVLSVYLKNAGSRNVLYSLVLWSITASLLPMAESLFDIRIYLSTGASNSVFTFLGYFALGYALRDLHLRPRQVPLFLLLFCLGFFVTAYGTYYATVLKNGGIFDGMFYEYFSVNVLVMSLCVYAVGKSIAFPAALLQCEKRFRIVRTVAACVPGIYLVHAMLIEVAKDGLFGVAFSQTTFAPALGVPVFALAIFLVSLIVVFIVKLLPGTRYIMP